MEIYCSACMRHREDNFFKKWLSNKNQARRCDNCLNDPSVTRKLENCSQERSAKLTNNTNTPLQVGLSKTEQSAEKRRVRDRIADIKQDKIDNDFIGL